MLHRSLCAAVLAALLFPGYDSAAAKSQTHHPVALVRRDHVSVYSKPSTTSPTVAVVVQQTQLEVLAQHAGWAHVALWTSVQGWVKATELLFRKPWSSVSTYRAPEIHYHVHAYPPQTIHEEARITSPVRLYSSQAGRARGALPSGALETLTGWSQDGAGGIWYRLRGQWAPGDAVQFQFPDPGLQRSAGLPLWKRASGKGMWLTLGTITDSSPGALVQAALKNGLTHLYLESAISPLGFHGRKSVGPLLEAAHRRHLAVIAWVYPYLYDLASDVALTRQVAAFRTASGDRFDGIAADLEQNISLSTVRAYSQLVRAYLGSSYLLVGVTYPPQSFPAYPFSEVAHDYNVIAPMDYWHQTKTAYGLDYRNMAYGFAYGYRYAQDSVTAIRRTSGHVPVAPIGQTFDNFGRLEMGPHAPSAGEVSGFLSGSKRSGAVGASFFQWMTAEVDEWHAIHDFRY